MRLHATAAICVILMSGCLPADTGPPDIGTPPAGPGATCSADNLQEFIGQPVNVFMMIQPGGPQRIIHPGDPITEDYSPMRLNVVVDENNIVQRLYCG